MKFRAVSPKFVRLELFQKAAIVKTTLFSPPAKFIGILLFCLTNISAVWKIKFVLLLWKKYFVIKYIVIKYSNKKGNIIVKVDLFQVDLHPEFHPLQV